MCSLQNQRIALDFLGKDLDVLRRFASAGVPGYLDICIGDRVRLLYIGDEDDDLRWVYGERSADQQKGWFPDHCLLPLMSREAVENSRGEDLEVLRQYSSGGLGGYLDLSIGDRVRLHYIDDDGWVHGEKAVSYTHLTLPTKA